MRSSVRDPYTRQTRLTLTQMIRKQAAENKKIRAELKRAQVKKGGGGGNLREMGGAFTYLYSFLQFWKSLA